MYIRMYVHVYVCMYAYVNAYVCTSAMLGAIHTYHMYIYRHVTAESQSSLPENDIRIRSTSLVFINGGTLVD